MSPSPLPVIQLYCYPAQRDDQELVADPMGVVPPFGSRRHLAQKEHSLNSEWDLLPGLRDD